MAQLKLKWTTVWFISLHITLHLFLVLVQGAEDTDEAYRNGRNLVLEYFLPINYPASALDVPGEREKRDVEGSGEDGAVFSEKNVEVEDADNMTQNAFARLIEVGENPISNLTNVEGSGEVDGVSENSSESSTEEDISVKSIIGDSEELTTTELSEESEEPTTTVREVISSEMVFDKSEDFTTSEVSEETTTIGVKPESTTISELSEIEITTDFQAETTTHSADELPSVMLQGHNESTTTEASEEFSTTVEIKTTPVAVPVNVESVETEAPTTTSIEEEKLEETESEKTTTVPTIVETTPNFIAIPVPDLTTSAKLPEPIQTSTQGLPIESTPTPTTPKPIVEEIIKEVKTAQETLEALPGNILRKENLSLGADPLLIVTNTRLMDSEETVQLSSAEPKRLGAYIVIGLILLSFSSLVGYITFRKRINRKRQEFESNQESHDTEKALLSLSDYKDNSELEENHLKNNEITPIVVKSNSQINKFEKNTNFSSPKNLNTIANEKNIEKDNVLKSTAENLTQVIIEDSPKDVEEDKNVPSMEKLIVRTRVDQDSIPKKPILINRSSTGYIPIPQDNL